MLHFMLGTAGSGKTNTVRRRIAEGVEKGESGIVLLTPEQYTFESEKALLNLLGATSADRAEVISFTRLVDYIGEDNPDFSKAYADTGIKAVILKKALLSVKGELLAFNNVKASPEFILSLLEIITELKQSNITSEELCASFKETGANTFNRKMHDLGLIISAYNAMLGEKYLDPDDDLLRLNDALNDSRYFLGKTVYIDAFDGFTMQQYMIIERIIRDAKDVYVSFCTDGAFDKEMGTGIFSNVKKEIARFIKIAKNNNVDVAKPELFQGSPRFKNEGLSCLERLLRGDTEDLDGICDSVTVCESNTLYDEVDYTARTIKKLVREDGHRYRDFTVIVRNMDDYRQIFDTIFTRYNIPCYLDKRADNNDLMLISYAVSILKTAVSGFSQENVFNFLKSPLSIMDIDEVSELENYVFIWNKGYNSWEEEWKCNPDGIDRPFNEKKLADINALRQKAVDYISPLKKAVETNDTRKICSELFNLISQSKTDVKLKEYAAELKDDGNLFLAELQYKSWDFFADLMDKTVAVCGIYTSPKELVETIEMLLKCDALSTIPARIDEVMIGDAYRIRPCDPKIVFVLGANYREMPMPPSNKGILTINDRAVLIENGIDINDRVTTDSIKERYAAYSSVCSASERVYVTYHLFDKENHQTIRSDFVNSMLNNLNKINFVLESECRRDRFESPAAAFEFFAENYDTVSCDYDKIDNGYLKNSINFIETARKGIAESVSPSTAVKLHGKDITISPSRLESYSKCPFSHFCRYDIHAKPIEQARINAIQRGTISHYVLEKLIKKYVSKLSEITDAELTEEIEISVKEYLDSRFAGFNVEDKEFIFTVERIKNMLFDILRNIGAELTQTEFKPVMFEQSISPDGEIKPIKIDTETGSAMIIGTVDRVDILEKDGKSYVRVIDYKTGKRLFNLSEILYGLNLQMLLYLFSITDSDESGNTECAGILYMPVRRNEYIEKEGLKDNNSYAMNGLVLSENMIPEAMEPEAKGRFIPYKYDRKGAYNSKLLISGDDFKAIKHKVIEVVRDKVDRMNGGDISRISVKAGIHSPCDFCDYSSVCLSANLNVETVPSDSNALKNIRSEAMINETDT